MGANMDYFPKKDKEYEKISILICKKSKEKTKLNINTLKSLFDHWGKGSRDLSETTKNAVSDFLGFDDWDDLVNNIDEIYNISRKYNRIIRRRNVSILETNLLGFEFAAFDIWRQGKNLGHYIVASGHVISEVRICKK